MMMLQRFVLFVFFMMSIFSVAIGSEVEKTELSVQRLLNPKGEIIVQKKVWDDSLGSRICTGSEIHSLPVIGKCPYIPGYVEIGFPSCTQEFDIPKKFTVKEISPGFNRLVCELDYTNATPVGAPICDYSDCLYVEIPEPEFPLK